MSDKRLFVLAHREARQRAMQAVAEAPDGWRVTVAPPGRTLPQNDRFHAICSDLARARVPWAGKPRDAAAWKVLSIRSR